MEALALMEGHATITEAAKAHDMRRMTLSIRLRRAAERGLDGSTPTPLPLGQVLRGKSTLYKIDDEGVSRPVLDWIKTKADPNLDDIVNAIQDVFDEYTGRSPAELIVPLTDTIEELLTVYCMADLHLGLYAWEMETGANFDTEKACEVLRNVMHRLVGASPASSVGILLGLGDFFHTDSSSNQTSKSANPLDVDSRYARCIEFGIKLNVEMIELMLEKHQVVIWRGVRGNHDEHSSIALSAAMAAWFRNNPRVIVDTSPSPHWVYQHGKTLLAATHGDMLKTATKMALWLAADNAKLWGDTCFRYVHFGHIHHVTAAEIGGAVMESHRSLSVKDAWHAASGYVSGRGMTAITYSKAGGEVSRQTVNIPHWSYYE
jgi:UDP-2,3-diacylglucosamine pyrophosphatase LpxH